MGQEIERKFLVDGEGWRTSQAMLYRQGYLNTAKERTVRIRLAGAKAFLTVKGVTQGATRDEFEYEIPVGDAEEMLDNLCERPLIEKRRYCVEHAGFTWEVDEFLGENEGLVVAEIELENESQSFKRPPWVGVEVTEDPRYFNANLVKNPYRNWRQSIRD